MITDSIQRAQALNPAKSFIVQAPAGSGKTELLTQRYLKLLTVCSQPENVLAMTFTNKAVAELTKRIIDALKSTKNPRPSQPHKQITYDLALQVMARSETRNWQLLQLQTRLKITTIDKLASIIVNRHPNRANWVSPSIIAEHYAQIEAYQHASEQVLHLLNDAEHSTPIAALLLYLDNNIEKFYRLTVHMLGKRDQWLPRLYQNDQLDAELLAQTADSLISEHLSELRCAATPFLSEKFFAATCVSTQSEMARIATLPGDNPADLSQWQAIARLCLTKNNWRKTLTKRDGFPAELKDEKNQIKQILQALSSENTPSSDTFRHLLFETAMLPEFCPDSDHSQILADMASVLRLCVAQLGIYFANTDTFDFIEVALRADGALNAENVSEIALFLDYQLQHLLIDEFQDTSITQFSLIAKLIAQWQPNEGKTLFLVGDPMQSIYRFRQSQVSLFIQAQQHGIADVRLTALRLNANFRSSGAIVAGNNRLFARIFPENANVSRGAITYMPSQTSFAKSDEKAIRFYPFLDNQAQAEANTVLKIIQQTLIGTPEASIAVLVRTRSHLSHISATLAQNHVVFEAFKTTPLKNHLFTRDLLILTRCLLHLGDKLAWLSLLRSKWLGLSLSDVLLLSNEDNGIVWTQLHNDAVLNTLSPDGKRRAAHCLACLSGAIEHSQRFSVATRLIHALKQLGALDVLNPVEMEIKTQFLRIIYACERVDSLTLDTIEAMLDGLYAPSTPAPVKLMTIHSAKGLEFDCVIIPGLGRAPRSDDLPIIQLQEFADKSLLIAPMRGAKTSKQHPTYAYLSFMNAQQAYFESMRLLYVAMTRAKTALHLLGATSQQKKANKNSLLAHLMPFYQTTFEDLESAPKTDNPAPVAPQLTRFATLNTPNPLAEPQGEPIDAVDGDDALFKRLFGTLLHHYYEMECFNPSVQTVRARLLEMGFSARDLGEYARNLLDLLTKTRTDSVFSWLFKARETTLVEAAFIDGGRTLIMDRIFIDAGIVWVIDFKTAGLLENETLEDFIHRQKSTHSQQLGDYQRVLAQIYPNPIKSALYCPAVQQFIEI